MARVVLALCFILLLTSDDVVGSSCPVVAVGEGENTICLQVRNEWTHELRGLRVEVDLQSLPRWLTVQLPLGGVDVPVASDEPGCLLLTVDVDVPPTSASHEFSYRLADASGNSWDYSLTLVATSERVPEQWSFWNYPNPFNPSTTIHYRLDRRVQVTLRIFSTTGQEVCRLVDSTMPAGDHAVEWNGVDTEGTPVASGAYFCHLQTGDNTRTLQMLVVK